MEECTIKEVRRFIWVLKPIWKEEDKEPEDRDYEVDRRKRKKDMVVPTFGGAICIDPSGLILTTVTGITSSKMPKIEKATVKARCYLNYFREVKFVQCWLEWGLALYQIKKEVKDEVFEFLNVHEVNKVEYDVLDKVFSFVHTGGNYSFRTGSSNFPPPPIPPRLSQFRILKDVAAEYFPYLDDHLPLLQFSNLGDIMNSGMSGCPVFKMENNDFLGLIAFCTGQFSLVIPLSVICHVIYKGRKRKRDDENIDEKKKKKKKKGGGGGGGRGGGSGGGGGGGGGGGRGRGGGGGGGRGGGGGGGGGGGRGGGGRRRGEGGRGKGGGGGWQGGGRGGGGQGGNSRGGRRRGVLCAKDNPTNRTLDLTSIPEAGPPTNQGASDPTISGSTRSVLTIIFQLPFESNLQESVATTARQYSRSVISSVQRVAMAITPTVGPKLSPGSHEALTLVHWIRKIYSCPGKGFYHKTQTGGRCNSFMALHYGQQIAQGTSGEVAYGFGRPVLRTFSQRLNRFNDAINEFSDDGWTLLNSDGAEDVIIACSSAKPFIATLNGANLLPVVVVLCAKASMLLENVPPPTVLVRLVREHLSEWADFSVDTYSAAALKANLYGFPGMRVTIFSGSQIIMPLDRTIEHEEDNLTNLTLDLTLSLEMGPTTNQGASDAATSGSTRSVLTIPFQLPFDSNLQESVATMAHQYIRRVISSVQRVALPITPSGLTPTVGPKLSLGSLEALILVHWICRNYCSHMGIKLLQTSSAIDYTVVTGEASLASPRCQFLPLVEALDLSRLRKNECGHGLSMPFENRSWLDSNGLMVLCACAEALDLSGLRKNERDKREHGLGSLFEIRSWLDAVGPMVGKKQW